MLVASRWRYPWCPLAINHVVLSRLEELVDTAPHDLSSFEVDHLESDLVVSGHLARRWTPRVERRNAPAQPVVAALLRAGQGRRALVHHPFTFEFALTRDHVGEVPSDECHATLSRSVQRNSKAIGDTVHVEPRSALVPKVFRVDDHTRRCLYSGERLVSQHVPHHPIGHADDVLGFDPHARNRSACPWVLTRRGCSRSIHHWVRRHHRGAAAGECQECGSDTECPREYGSSHQSPP